MQIVKDAQRCNSPLAAAAAVWAAANYHTRKARHKTAHAAETTMLFTAVVLVNHWCTMPGGKSNKSKASCGWMCLSACTYTAGSHILNLTHISQTY
jgi:hypothetical protein